MNKPIFMSEIMNGVARAKQAQRLIRMMESAADGLCDLAAMTDNATALSISPEDAKLIRNICDELRGAITRAHNELSDIAPSSTDGEIVAFGPGDKGGD